MTNNRLGMSIFIPLVSVLTIIGFGGGLGVVFILLNELVWEEWATVILGSVLVVGVPTVAALVQRMVDAD